MKPAREAPLTVTRLPKTLPPVAAVNPATKQALAPPQCFDGADLEVISRRCAPPVGTMRLASRGIDRGSSTGGAWGARLMAAIW